MSNNRLIKDNFYSNVDSSFCELTQIQSKCIAATINDKPIYYSAYNFLSGYCLVFAYVLHLRFGYDVVIISNDSGTEVHCCCYYKYMNYDLYIDVRGGTANLDKLLQPFPNIDSNYPKIDKITDFEKYIDEWDPELMSFANDIIEQYYDYYYFK
ncbi:MAG: hypothetical protein J5982_00270 [Bacilli bacterium]|nr:hypothetical protein [Bacilli bacterium]